LLCFNTERLRIPDSAKKATEGKAIELLSKELPDPLQECERKLLEILDSCLKKDAFFCAISLWLWRW